MQTDLHPGLLCFGRFAKDSSINFLKNAVCSQAPVSNFHHKLGVRSGIAGVKVCGTNADCRPLWSDFSLNLHTKRSPNTLTSPYKLMPCPSLLGQTTLNMTASTKTRSATAAARKARSKAHAGSEREEKRETQGGKKKERKGREIQGGRLKSWTLRCWISRTLGCCNKEWYLGQTKSWQTEMKSDTGAGVSQYPHPAENRWNEEWHAEKPTKSITLHHT